MARLPRLTVPGEVHWVRQMGVAESRLFQQDDEYSFFLQLLREGLSLGGRESSVEIYAYTLMPQYFDLLCLPQHSDALSKLMQWVGRRYVAWYNRRNQRSGVLWQRRYRSVVLEQNEWLVPAMCLIESQPVVQGLATEAVSYPWSSASHHLGLIHQAWLQTAPAFWALANTPYERQAAYKQYLESGLKLRDVDQLEQAIKTGWPLGSSDWLARLQLQTSRRLQPAARGRPRSSHLS